MKNLTDRDIVPEFFHNPDHGHLDGVLDEMPPWIYQKLIPLLSANIRVDDDVADKIREAARTGPLVYAMKFRSVFDLHFLRMRFAQLKLPVPAFVFETPASATGSLLNSFRVWRARLSGMLHDRKWPISLNEDILRDILLRGGPAVLFLVDEKTSRKRYVHPESDPIRMLLDLQGRIPGSIAVIPMMILYDRTPRRQIRPVWESLLGNPDKPGPLKRIHTALRKWAVPELLAGEPLYLLGQFEEFGSEKPWEDLPFEVRKDLIASINERIRVNRGPEKLSRTEIKERVLQDRQVREAVHEMVTEEGIAEEKVRRKAESYVDEIAGDQVIELLNFWVHVLKWAFNRVFSAVDIKESQFAQLKKANADGSLVLVSSHKSHFDYLLIGHYSFVNQMAIPYIAAGRNLYFWPLGPMMRKTGAFFLRRSFKGLRLYPQVFAAYVKVLVRERVNLNFYIEGSRSRTGKFLPPKTGLLAFLLQTVQEGAVPDLLFVPTFVGYDQIPEENSYLRELEGREKRKEGVLEVIRARKVLGQRFGRAYMRFDQPVSFRSFLKKWNKQGASRESGNQTRELIQDFAYHIMSGIVRAGVVTPVELAAAGLMCSGKTQIDRSAVLRAIELFATVIRTEGFEFAESLEKNFSHAQETAIGHLCERGFAEVDSETGESGAKGYAINERARVNLQFYKNALVNLLWPASICATVLLMHGKDGKEITPAMREDFLFLARLLSRELICDPLVPADETLEHMHKVFATNGWIPEYPEGSDGGTQRGVLESFRGILADLIELYYVVLCGTAAGSGLSQKEFLKILAQESENARTGTDLGTIPLPVVAVRNALGQFTEMGLLEYNQQKKVLNSVLDQEALVRTREFLHRALTGRVSGRDAVS
jgi:glycerol-3-phosphate O-acyltransferase